MGASSTAAFVTQFLVALLFVVGASSDGAADPYGEEVTDPCGEGVTYPCGGGDTYPCGNNTEPRDCGPPQGCEDTCATLDRPVICLEVCSGGCYCQRGYVRKQAKGPCILESDCFE